MLKIEPKNKFEKILFGQKKNLEKIYFPFFEKYFKKKISDENIFSDFDENLFYDILKNRKISFIKKNEELNIKRIQKRLIRINRNSSLKMGFAQFIGGSFSQNLKYMLQKVFK